MNKPTSIGALFDALTANMSAAEIKTAMITSDISSKITIERCNKGMTQKEFAKFMGVSQGMISKWESGDYNFTIESISNIFDKLNLDFEFKITSDYNIISEENIKIDSFLKTKPNPQLILLAG